MNEDDILAAIEDEAPQPTISAILVERTYEIVFSREDFEFLEAAPDDKATSFINSFYRRGCHNVHMDWEAGVLHVSLDVGSDGTDKLEHILQSAQEELDDITGRKMEQAGAEAWGMF